MIDRSEYPIATLATIFAWAATNPVAVWFELHPLSKTLAQGMITIALGCGAVIAQHFLRRYLRRNWPDEERQNVAPPQGETRGQGRFDLLGLVRRMFEFVRRQMSRLRGKVKRRRKAS